MSRSSSDKAKTMHQDNKKSKHSKSDRVHPADAEISDINDEPEPEHAHEGEESEKEVSSESEASFDLGANFIKPESPSVKKSKYFERLKNKRNYENKVILVNYQYQNDYEFFLKKLYYLYTLKPKLVILSYNEKDKTLKPYFLNKLAEINDVRVIIIKQSDKERLLESMTYMTGRKMNKKRILDGIQVRSKKVSNSIVYSWG